MPSYSAIFEPDRRGGFIVRILEFPNIVTQAESLSEAREMAIDAVRTFFLGQIATGAPIPEPRRITRTKNRAIHRIALPALDSAKIALYRLFLSSGLRKAQLARQIGIPRTHIDRLFDLRHASRLDQIEAAFAALGHQLVISAKSAA